MSQKQKKLKPVHLLGIDAGTKTVKTLCRRLKALTSTHEVSNGGAYREDTSYSQVHVSTSMTEKELDHWLWSNCNKGKFDYVGVFPRTC